MTRFEEEFPGLGSSGRGKHSEKDVFLATRASSVLGEMINQQQGTQILKEWQGFHADACPTPRPPPPPDSVSLVLPQLKYICLSLASLSFPRINYGEDKWSALKGTSENM